MKMAKTKKTVNTECVHMEQSELPLIYLLVGMENDITTLEKYLAAS